MTWVHVLTGGSLIERIYSPAADKLSRARQSNLSWRNDKPKGWPTRERVGRDERWGNVSTSLIVPFMAEQWVLIAALAVTLMMLVFHETRKAGPALSINEAVQLVNSEGGIFVDVRDAADFGRGHITNAVNIPSAALAGRMSELEKFREKPVVVVCKMGQSAAGATKALRAEGFARAQKLTGGMMEWDAQKLPVVTQ